MENGGAYIGLCAGAYYASSYVEFGIGTKYDLPSHVLVFLMLSIVSLCAQQRSFFLMLRELVFGHQNCGSACL